MALLLVPLVSLLGLWGYTAFNAVNEARGLLRVVERYEDFTLPVEDTIRAVQTERRQALLFLADPRRPGALGDLRTTQKATDRQVARLRAPAGNADARENLNDRQRYSLETLLEGVDRLGDLRSKIGARQITRIDAFSTYTTVTGPGNILNSHLSLVNESSFDRDARNLAGLALSREALSRVDALATAALASGRMSKDEHRAMTAAAAEQSMLDRSVVPHLPVTDRKAHEAFAESTDYKKLMGLENAMVTAGAPGAPTAARPAEWRGAFETAFDKVTDLFDTAVERHESRTEPYADGVLVESAAVTAAGLLAVIATTIISIRIGRRLVRDLTRLRKAAIELSGNRLPRVMRRLAAGEDVAVETEAAPLDFGGDAEIRQVGEAFNDVQRAAVRAAVKQAELRQGISKVFVNLARRSQVLLHRQLTLLETMERRTEDAEELADLFRLDHMTTRMRRHAEGLVILSGVTPSRAWRNPVLLMNVVRAAVAEVEDYERVEVRRMPRVGVVGAAVGDITHLVAELVENATVFSPPHTPVHVHGERVANGFVLEVDDRGLGLTAEQVLEANQRLAETPEFELSDTDRLGLFVVSRLARRHGVRVSLRPSAYGGTTAVVLIPSGLLTEDLDPSSRGSGNTAVADGGPDADDAGASAAQDAFPEWGPTPARGLPGLPVGAADRHDHVPAPDDDLGGLPRRVRAAPVLVSGRGRAADGPRDTTEHVAPTGRTEGRRVPAAPGGPGPDPRPGTVRSTGRGAAGTREPVTGGTGPHGSAPPGPAEPDGLPRRVRQASLAPQLRSEPSRGSGPGEQEPGSARERSADEVRARMASFQRGWQRGRRTHVQPGQSGPADPAGGPGGPAVNAPRSSTEEEGDGR